MRLLFISWLAIFLLIFTFQWASDDELRKLKNRSATTTGKIIAIQPEQHQTVRYEYEVGEETFVRSGGVNLIGKSLYEMKVGDSVPVFYYPENPTISRIGNPHSISIDWKTKLLSSVAFSIIAVLIASLMRNLKMKNNYLPDKSV